MKQKQFTTACFSALGSLSELIQHGEQGEIIQAIDAMLSSDTFSGVAWQGNLKKLRGVILTGTPAFSIFKLDGNKKLPFVAFSTLPGVTCSGAGGCLEFCYSFRAWRYPAAFARQAQNAWLMRHHQDVIRAGFHAVIRSRVTFEFRLYVDGDFSSVADVAFWMSLLEQNPGVKAYGYSKSFRELLTYDMGNNWPKNYQLNISSGHKYGQHIVDMVKALPITRGEFIAVPIGRKVKSSEHGKPEINAAIRAAFGSKVFPCPGKCGACTGKGHACGMPALKGVTIAIAMH